MSKESGTALRSGAKNTDSIATDMENKELTHKLRKLADKMDEMSGNITKELNSKVGRLESTIQKSQSQVLSELAKQSKEICAHMDLEIGRLEARIDTLEIKINVDTKASKARFDPNVSIIILGLPEEEEEDIQMKVQQLVIKGLGSEAVPIAVERMRAYGRAPGVVKAEFRSVHEKVAILRRKQQLREQQEFSRVYICSAKSCTERLIETNFKTLLKEIPGGSEFYVAGNGRLRRKEQPRVDGHGKQRHTDTP